VDLLSAKKLTLQPQTGDQPVDWQGWHKRYAKLKDKPPILHLFYVPLERKIESFSSFIFSDIDIIPAILLQKKKTALQSNLDL
jgi:hypothetical protein